MTRFSATAGDKGLKTTSFRMTPQDLDWLRAISRQKRQHMRLVISELIRKEAKRLGIDQSE